MAPRLPIAGLQFTNVAQIELMHSAVISFANPGCGGKRRALPAAFTAVDTGDTGKPLERVQMPA